jgi:hypothetical protein
MSIIVEDGSGVSGANSYVTVSGVGVYATTYGYTEWDTDANGDARTDAVKEQSLLRAMRYIEGLNWKGKTAVQGQALQWPRSEVYDRDQRLVDEDVVPQVVIDAVCEACMLSVPDSDINLQPNLTKDDYVNYEQVTGAVTVSYTLAGGPIAPRSAIIEDLLKGLLRSSNQLIGRRG